MDCDYIEYWRDGLASFNFGKVIPILKNLGEKEAESFIEDTCGELASRILSIGKDIIEKDGKLYCECGYKFENINEAAQSYCPACLEGLAHEEYPGSIYDDSCMQEADNLLKSAWIDLHKK